MRKILQEIFSGLLIIILFFILTLTLIKSLRPEKYLSFYLALELIAYFFFSVYGAAAVAITSTFVALGSLLIAKTWLSLAAIPTFWGTVAILSRYLTDLSKDYGIQKLEIENKEKNIGELLTEEKKFSSMLPILDERILRYKKMAEFSLELSTTFDDDKLYSIIHEYVMELFPDKKLFILTEPQDMFDEWLFEHKGQLLVEDSRKDYRFKEKKQTDFLSLISHPLFQGNEISGIIRIESKEERFAPSDLRLLQIASTLSSLALEKSRLFIKTEELAITDNLTALYTHTYFKERLEEEVKRAARYGEQFVFLLMDIDNFKLLNDNFGHPSGDVVLQNVANTITQMVRETDIVGRYGGEEISVILHSITQEEAMRIAGRIKTSIEKMEFVFNYRKVNVTVTIGASCFPQNPTAEVLIMRADEALYRGKSKGKNIVVFHSDD